MQRAHALFLSVAIGVIAIVGLFAASRTVGLGHQARSAADRQVAQRTVQLDRYAASLRAALARSATTPSQASPATAADGPVKIVYHRPPPIVVTTHRTGEHEGAGGGESDD